MATIVRFPGHHARPGRPGRPAPAAARAYDRAEMPTTIERVCELGARFRLGDWLVEAGLNRISRGGSVVQLESKAMDVLVLLASRAGELVSRAELQDAVWQTEFVSYNTLVGRISELREALEDDARQPRYIETVPKRGYRLIAAVSSGPGARPGPGVLAEVPREGPDERPPYPGLEPFREADAQDFFGREAEIAALWRKIASRRLLAVVGPSGAGKSSLLRAGVVARAPPGWRAVVCQPGEEPFLAVARALAPDLMDDAEEVRRLLAFSDPDMALAVAARWRGRWDEALLVVDQFEELFTLAPQPVRERFVELLRRLVNAAGIHVVLVLRDDFLLECHRYPELAPIFSDLTPVGPPAGAELRRAVTEPAARRLYGFEGELLVDEMVGEVEAERGALPLLAFAMSRLWELRDRERRLLTREAYARVGGVGGALAQHAEATLEAIGPERLPVVRELFRNLVTAQGTRAVREVGELESVFEEGARAEARAVLRALVDARLLTSFEDAPAEVDAGGTRHRVEIVHESLLGAWPRLQRWQAQDAEGALLRDQLRQAARLWAEKGRSDDLLWTGTAFQEYQVWRARYPGGLSAVEEAFGRAMTGLAGRRRRRRRLLIATVLAALAVGLGVTGLLWRRSVTETRRAEASKLLALAQARLADDPTEALALTTASLELADTREAREHAVRVLETAPPALELDMAPTWQFDAVSLSPDGRRVAAAGQDPAVRVWSEDGRGPTPLAKANVNECDTAIWAADDLLVTGGFGTANREVARGERAQVWSLPEGRLLRTVEVGAAAWWTVGPRRLFAVVDEGEGSERRVQLECWRLPDGEAETLDVLSGAEVAGVTSYEPAPDGSGWVVARGSGVYLHPRGGGPERLLDVLDAAASVGRLGPTGVLARDEAGDARLWSFAEGGPRRVWAIRGPVGAAGALPDPAGRRLLNPGPSKQSLQVWELGAMPGARPLELRRGGSWYDPTFAFHPRGDWCAAMTSMRKRLTFWPLARPHPFVVEGYRFPAFRSKVAFSPDSRWLATGWEDGRIRLLPVPGGEPAAVRELHPPGAHTACDIRFDPTGRYLVVTGLQSCWLVPIDGGPCREVVPGDGRRHLEQGAISPSGAKVATAFGAGEGERSLYLHDVASGALQRFPLPQPSTSADLAKLASGLYSLEFLDEQTLLTSGQGGVRRWDLATGAPRLLKAADDITSIRASPAAGLAVTWAWYPQVDRPVELLDLATGASRPLPAFGEDVDSVDLDPSGRVLATGSRDGTVRVDRVSGSEPHLLLGHAGVVRSVAISPDLRWVASSGEDSTLRLWPMPDLSKPPLHTLPHDDLLAKLEALTNLRAVRDPASATGWKLEVGPFPGWREAPTW